MLAAYEYTLVFRGTEAHSNADALCRLPLSIVPAEVPTPPELVLMTEHLAESPVMADHIWSWTLFSSMFAKAGPTKETPS